MKVPFVDLARQHLPIKGAIEEALHRVLNAGDFILGSAVEAFEKDFARYLGAPHAVGTGNGLDALSMILKGLGIGPGDEVLVPANTFIATAFSVSAAGATPVFVDCDPETLAIDPTKVGEKITSRTKALSVVHLYGRIAEMDALSELAREHELLLLEDAAQAHGAIWRGTRAGMFGVASSFSFYPSKNLGALGDAGIAVTPQGPLADRLRAMRNYGGRQKYLHDEMGQNSRLDTLHAAVLAVKLPHLDRWNGERQKAAGYYVEELKGVVPIAALPRAEGDGKDHVHHLFIVRVPERERVQQELADLGIQTGIHYPVPIHLQPAYRDLGYRAGDFPVAEKAAKEILSLPMFPGITRSEQDLVVSGLKKALRR